MIATLFQKQKRGIFCLLVPVRIPILFLPLVTSIRQCFTATSCGFTEEWLISKNDQTSGNGTSCLELGSVSKAKSILDHFTVMQLANCHPVCLYLGAREMDRTVMNYGSLILVWRNYYNDSVNSLIPDTVSYFWCFIKFYYF